MSARQTGTSSGTQQIPQVPTEAYDRIVGYQALGNLMGSFPEVAIFRRFRSAGALDLLYREAELLIRIDSWAQIANGDRNADNDEGQRKEFDINFGLLWGAYRKDPKSKLGSQWRAWLEIREHLGQYHDSLLKLQKIYNLPAADEKQLKQLREQLEHTEQGNFFLKGIETLTFPERDEGDLTSIASLDEPDLVTKLSRGPVVDFYHQILGLKKKQDIKVPQLAVFEEDLTFPYKAYSPEYALKVSRLLYAAGISILITAAIVMLNFFKNVVGRIVLIGINNLIFTLSAAFLTKSRAAELFAVAAAYAAVLVVFANGATGLSQSS